MSAGYDTEDDEWEYEYSTTETETFLVDVDLSTVNGFIKSKNAGDRKSLKISGKLDKSATISNDVIGIVEQVQNGMNVEGGEDNDEGATEGYDKADEGGETQPQTNNVQQVGIRDDNATSRLQILDFSSENPIISYEGKIYSCTWHDTLGTSMFISKHQEAPFHEPDISTDDYDLIGITRIKLIGQHVTAIPKVASKKRRRDENDPEDTLENPVADRSVRPPKVDGSSLGTIKRTNPKTNMEIKQQANFLEKLMEVKKSRGDVDTVRTFVDRHTIAADAKRTLKAREAKQKGKEKEENTEKRLRREIHELNKRVVKGDNMALERLQEIYADLEEAEDDEEADNDNEDSDDMVPIRRASGTRLPRMQAVDAGSANTPSVPIPAGSADTPHATE